MRVLIDAIEHAMTVEARGGVQIVPRINFGVEGGFFRLMPAVIEELDIMGLKAFDAKFPEARYLIAVFRPSTGELDCLVDAAYLTAARTGATTGVATRWMTATDGCREVGVIGSGLEARTNLEAVLAAREVQRVKVFSPNPQRRRRFAGEIAERFGIEAVATDAAAEAADAPCVVAATNTGANGPVALEGAWLRDDAHPNALGATGPALRAGGPGGDEHGRERPGRARGPLAPRRRPPQHHRRDGTGAARGRPRDLRARREDRRGHRARGPRVRRHHRRRAGRDLGRAAGDDARAAGRRPNPARP